MRDIKALLKELTIEEKASLSSGLFFWTTKPIEGKVPAVTMTDGPHGLRKEFGADSGKGGVNIMKGSEPATCFPPAVSTASSWDRNLIDKIGKAIALEARALKVSTVLGPGTNIKRSPLCGRNFEYFSEDPYLSGEMSKSYVRGVQSQDVGCSLKHFATNNEEFCRMSIDSRVDERALREIYLPAFEVTVKEEQPQQVMCSYNKLDGTYLCENKRMLTDILRNEWGFKGLVVSDWGAVNNRVDCVKAGLDLQMPGDRGMNDKKILQAIKDGHLTEEELDKTTERVLNYVFDCVDKKPTEDEKVDFEAHYALAREAANSCAVLMKNEMAALPIKDGESLAIIGKLAEECRYQGSGSSRICCQKLSNVLEGLDGLGVKYDYSEGYTLEKNGFDEKLLAKALKVAKGKDKVVAVIGLTDVYESEGFDRSHMDLPEGHNILVEELLKVNPNVIVVLQGGSPVTMPWRDRVKAILNTYLPGEAVGDSTADLIMGRANPSGKLAETYPLELKDVLAQKYFPMGPRTVEYRESIFVGYRYFDSAKREVAFPFGFGLSYTTFEYSDFLIPKNFKKGEAFKVSYTVTNTGDRKGAEVSQVYVGQKNSPVFKAVRELKSFEKTVLESGESKRVTVTLSPRDFSFYNTEIGDWSVLDGEYTVEIGASSRDIKFAQSVTVEGDGDIPLPLYSESVREIYFNMDKIEDVPQEAFRSLYGKELPDNEPYKVGEFHVNSTVGEIGITPLGKFINGVARVVGKIVAGDAANSAMILNSITSMPLRSLSGFSGGILSMHSVEGLVKVFNKEKGGYRQFFAGFKKKYR